MSRPSALAVLRLITSSYLVGGWTGRSAVLLALEDLPGVDADLAIRVSEVCSVAHQTTGRDELTLAVDCGIAWRAASATS